jgi:hypothetical protein
MSGELRLSVAGTRWRANRVGAAAQRRVSVSNRGRAHAVSNVREGAPLHGETATSTWALVAKDNDVLPGRAADVATW